MSLSNGSCHFSIVIKEKKVEVLYVEKQIKYEVIS